MDFSGGDEWDLSFGNFWGNGVVKLITTLENSYMLLAIGSSSANTRGRLINLNSSYIPVLDITYNAAEQTYFRDIYQLKDSSFIVTGYQNEGDDLANILVMKINQQGDSLWSKTFSGGFKPSGGGYQDYGVSIIENKDSTLSILCQFQSYQVSILKLTAEGDSITNQIICYGSPGTMIKDGNSLVITGEFRDYPGTNSHYAFLLKTDSLGNFEDLINGVREDDFGSSNEKWLIHPNPARDEFFVRTTFSESSIIKTYDLMGRVVYTSQTISLNEPFTKIDVRDWNNGLYIVEIGEHRVRVVVNH